MIRFVNADAVVFILDSIDYLRKKIIDFPLPPADHAWRIPPKNE